MAGRLQLNGKTVIITGAASGIGRNLALNLAKRGCHLALADVDMEGLEETERLARTNRIRISRHKLNVADKDAIKAFPDQVLEDHECIDILFNNAGVAIGGTFEEIAEDDFDWLMEINLWGVIRMTRAFLPHIRKSQHGGIVNISSLFGLVAPPGQTAYCASKFGVKGFSQSLRHELADTNINVTVVHPGGVSTRIAKSARHPKGTSAEEIQKQVKRADKHLVMPPEQAAEIIIRGVEKGKSRVLVGNDAKLISLLERIAPASYWNVLSRVIGPD